MLSREQVIEFDNCDLLNRERNYDRNRIEQRLLDMSRQIGKLTNIYCPMNLTTVPTVCVIFFIEEIDSNFFDLN